MEMRIEPSIRDPDQRLVESLFTALGGFDTGHKHHGPPHGIEGEGNGPFPAGGREPKLLHVGVLRSIQRIDARTLRRRPELLDDPQLSDQLILHFGIEHVIIRTELVGELYTPHLSMNMFLREYGLHSIFSLLPRLEQKGTFHEHQRKAIAVMVPDTMHDCGAKLPVFRHRLVDQQQLRPYSLAVGAESSLGLLSA